MLESRYGCIVVHCSTFASLKRELDVAAENFDLAILDLCLADAPDGEALDLVLSHSVPAIVFSGYTSDARRSAILADGAAEIVYKNSPRSLDRLAEAVERQQLARRPAVAVIGIAGKARPPVLHALRPQAFSAIYCDDEDQAMSAIDASKGSVELLVVPSELAERDGYALFGKLALRFGEDTVRTVGYALEPGENELSRFLAAGGDDFLHMPMSAADVEARLAHTLNIHRQIQSLRRMASRDYLTDMLNRRYFFDRGPKLVDMCLRQSAPACAALVDIDHFKRLNDTYGHEVGDLVLKAVSRKLLQLVGEKNHLPARIGGEEFALLLTNMDVEQAFDFCERIRLDIAKTRIVIDDEDLTVTVSMGLAAISGAESFDNYLNAADQYLYLAKHAGRNRVFSDYQVQKIAAS
jgi:diguanylate cyclase (GGDEF)-like protein